MGVDAFGMPDATRHGRPDGALHARGCASPIERTTMRTESDGLLSTSVSSSSSSLPSHGNGYRAPCPTAIDEHRFDPSWKPGKGKPSTGGTGWRQPRGFIDRHFRSLEGRNGSGAQTTQKNEHRRRKEDLERSPRTAFYVPRRGETTKYTTPPDYHVRNQAPNVS